MKAFWLGCLVWLLALPMKAQPSVDDVSTVFRYVERKNYYFTSLLHERADVDSLLATSGTLNEMTRTKLERLSAATDPSTSVAAFRFTEDEIQQIGRALTALYQSGNALDRMMRQVVLPSGRYQQYRETGAALLQRIWEQDAQGMNYAIDVYAAGRRPNYPRIDSIGFQVNSRVFREEILPLCRQNILRWAGQHPKFYSIPLKAVSLLLDLNDRLQAADFEPMETGVNRASRAQLARTSWERYPYTAILVLGSGPEERDVSISPIGKMRAAYAALLYRDGQAPFIIVSGGRVHPYHTPYSEAYEMKKYLMDTWQVPEEAILMEPHARHTTTNFRNAARLMLAYGFPLDRPAIATSSQSHIDSAEHTLLARCVRELGYEPYRLGRRVSDRVLEFFPLPVVQIINPSEPMDP